MKHEYTDTQLQAAIDEACKEAAQSAIGWLNTLDLDPQSEVWAEETPARLDLIKSALATLPEPESLVTKPISLTSPTQMNDGGPAFPITENGLQGYNGMSLRDYFAGQAMTAIIGSLYCTPETSFKEVSGRAYAYADAMLKAREVKP